jgi:GntR family transcriptional regulator
LRQISRAGTARRTLVKCSIDRTFRAAQNRPAMPTPLPLPKYHRVYLVLREQLQDGRFADGVPGELALMEHFGVARVTVRRALAQLADEGLIARERGRGTRPLGSKESAQPVATQLTGLLENLVSMGVRTSVKVLDASVLPATPEVAHALALAVGDPVQKAVRVRSTRHGPIAHITTFVPADVAQRFGARELASQPILLLLEAAGVKVGRAVQTISARAADAAVAAALDVPLGTALLAVNRLIHDEHDRPVQWLHGLYRPDRYRYDMQLSAAGEIDARVWIGRDEAGPIH